MSDFNSLQCVSFLHSRVEIRYCAGFNCCFYSTTTSCDRAPPCRQQLVETKLVEAAAVRRDRSDIGNSAVAVKQHNSGNKVGSSSANMIASSAISSNITNTGNTGLGIFLKILRAELVITALNIGRQAVERKNMATSSLIALYRFCFHFHSPE